MRCRACTKHLPAWLDGELAPKLADEVAAHLQACGACAAERRRLEALLRVVDSVEAPPLSAGFDAAFRTKLAEARVAAAASSSAEPPRRAWWRLPALGAAAAALAVAVVVGVTLRSRTHPTLPEGEVAIAQNLELLRDYEVVSNLDALEDFAVVSDLDTLMEDAR
jgi:anti-sigma factor RsiW